MRPTRRGTAPFEDARRRVLRFEVGRIDHQLIRFSTLCGQHGEDLVEHAHAAPADEPNVDRLGGAVLGGCAVPTQASGDRENNAANDPTIINSRHPRAIT